jgi:hypothetical protein
MSDLSNVVINKDNLSKVRGKDQPFADIQMPISFGDRGGEFPEGRIL